MTPIEFFQRSARIFKGVYGDSENYISAPLYVTTNGKDYKIESIGLNNLINNCLKVRFEDGNTVALRYNENFDFEYASDFDVKIAREWIFKDENITANDIVKLAIIAVQFQLRVYRCKVDNLIETEIVC